MRSRGFIGVLGACLVALIVCGCYDEPTSPADTTAPGAVTDLRASQPTGNSIELAWTAPGDDGPSGRAARYDIRQLNGTITEANWALAMPVAAEIGSPKTAGEAETIVVQNLVPGQEYCFALRASDEAPNWSPLSNVATLATSDIEPPATITDLVVQSVGDTTVTLAWTAPGDDGPSGRATAYDIRYSVAPLSAANWAEAHPVEAPPAPAEAGVREIFVVPGLPRFATYCFAVRAEDESHNVAAPSNAVQARTTFTPRNEGELVEKLMHAYQWREYDLYESLFPAPSEAGFLFLLSEPLPDGTTSWGLAEELRIHKRMFEPESPQPGEPPVPQELWPVSIVIVLPPLTAWAERPDLYRSPANPDGLDPARFRATEAEYRANVLWDMQGDTDYRVDGRQNFVVIEDLTRSTGESGKFTFYRWEDLGTFVPVAPLARAETWGRMKMLYK